MNFVSVKNTSIANNEELAKSINYRNLVKSRIRSNIHNEQIYVCAFQVVLHPDTFEPVIIWLNPEYTKIDDVILFSSSLFDSNFKTIIFSFIIIATFAFLN